MRNIYLLLFFLFSTSFVFSQSFSSGSISVAIPDGTSVNACNSINVSGIGNVDGTSVIISSVCVYIDHTYNGDLYLSLVSPNGTTIDLSNGNGGGGDDYGTSIGSMCFDMYAASSITSVSSTGPITGSYKPEGSFYDFNGENADGNWQFCVYDDYNSDSGTILGWSITFGTPPAPTCSDGIMNQDETGIDCGGVCPACGLGDDCFSPQPISSIPYTHSASTCGAGDDFSSSDACSSSYLGGEDYVYIYTPSADENISVDLTTNATYVGVIITEGCPDVGTCVQTVTSSGASASASPISLTAGTTYYFTVSTWPSPDCIGNFTLDLDVVVPSCSDGVQNQGEVGVDCGGPCPACGLGDDVCNPIGLTVETTCNFVGYNNLGATDSPYPGSPGCASYSGEDVWFSVTVPASGRVIVDQDDGTITDGGMAIYSGTDCNNLTLLECDDDDSNNGAMPMIDLTGLTIGETLWIRVWDYGGGTGTFSICAHSPVPTCTDGIMNQDETGIDCGGVCPACPEGMTCATPLVINSLPYSAFSTTCGMEDDYSATACGSTYMDGEDFIYEYTPAVDETVSANLTNTSGISMGLFILDDCPSNATATCVSYSESDAGLPTICNANLTGGQTYYVVVGSQSTTSCSNFKLNMSVTSSIPDTISTCSDVFYDSGGSSADYPVCENSIITYCPDDPALATQIDFTSFQVDESDILCIYDGRDTSDLELGCFYGSDIPNQTIRPTYLNSSGCLTMYFHSDEVPEGADGWVANISCSPPCQEVVAYSTGGVPFIDICQGDEVHFEGLGIYPDANPEYVQDDATSTFVWTINNEIVANTQDFYYTFPNEGGYNIGLTIYDVNGCSNLNDIQQKVRVSLTPSFAGTKIIPTTVCAGTTVNLTGMATPGIWNAAAPVVLADTTFLPDGDGDEYTAPLFFSSFNFGQTLDDVNDIVDICLNIEHSYLGDLDVFIECPSGNTAMLFDLYTGSGSSSSGAYLGYPLGGTSHSDYDNTPWDDPTVNLPGAGDDYCFSMSGTTTINDVGTGSGVTVPSDTYQPVDSYNPLVGCPLNGTWSIHVIDNIPADNGYIFNWSINFDESLYPAPWSFEPSIPNEGVWTGQWLPGDTANVTSFVANNNGVYDYTYTVVDNMGCEYDTILSVDVNSFGIDIDYTEVSCYGECDGEIDLTVNNATTAVSFLWSTGATTEDLIDLCAGTYKFTATDATGCFITDSIVITEPDSILIVLESLTEASCSGVCDGEAIISVSGGDYPYSYDWGGTITADSIATGLCAQLYTVNITDASGCKTNIQIDVNEPNALVVDIIDSSYTTCYDTCDGYALCQVTYGTTPYSYLWSSGDTIAQTNILCDGWAFISVTDANGCTAQDSILIQEPTEVTAMYNLITNAHCGFSDGSATVIPSGGTTSGNYNYDWGGGNTPTAATNTGLASAAYNVTITDDNSCLGFINVLIQDEDGVVAEITDSTDAICFGSNDGTATVTVTANFAPDYTYTWTGHTAITSNLETNTVSDLVAGIYVVTVTDVNGCNYLDEVIIEEPEEVTATVINQVNASCNGYCDGQVTINPAGGTAPYTYFWSNGSSLQIRTDLCAGSYTVTIFDSNMCEGTVTFTITQPDMLFVNTNHTDVFCFGQNSGTATAQAVQGTSPYTYAWSGNAGNQAYVNQLYAGTYTVTATDANGCTATSQATIGTPNPLQSTVTVTSNVTCYGDCNGVGQVSVSDGTPPYSYYWANYVTNQVNSQLCAGNTYVTIWDDNGCQAFDTITITEPDELVAIISSYIRPSCYDSNNGAAFAEAVGGTPGYTYLWGNGTTSQNISGLAAGNYFVNVKDANGCTALTSQMITAPSKLKILASPSEKWICENMSVTFNASRFTGGTAPYEFIWSYNGAPIDTADEITVWPIVTPSVYFVKGIDGNGCYSDPLSVIAKIYPPVSALYKPVPTTICPGDTVSVSATLTGGQGFGYTCTIEGGGMVTPPFNLIPEGEDMTINYIITTTDYCGSQPDVDEFEITLLPTPPNVFFGDVLAGCPPLTVNFHENSVAPEGEKYSWHWDFHDGDLNNVAFGNDVEHTFEESGKYDITLEVKSKGGCTHTETKEDYIWVYQNPTARFSVNPTYASILEPVFYFTNNSLFNNFNYWDFGDGEIESAEEPDHEYNEVGNYPVQLVVETNYGCTDTTVLMIKVNDEYTLYAPTAFSPDFDGINDVFYIWGHGIDPNEFLLRVYNRWGELIFETDKYDNSSPEQYGWDGSLSSGNIAEIGVYTWYLIYRDNLEVQHEASGTITLIK